MMNAAKDNGTTETIEKLEKLRQIMEDKKVDAMEVGEEQDILMEQVKASKKNFNDEKKKSEKYAETIQILQKDLKRVKSSKTAAENSA